MQVYMYIYIYMYVYIYIYILGSPMVVGGHRAQRMREGRERRKGEAETEEAEGGEDCKANFRNLS